MQRKTDGTLGEKISDILTPVPTIFDPEDDINEESTAKLVDKNFTENEDKQGDLGQLRKQNLQFLDDVDERYLGKQFSRKEFEDDSSIDVLHTDNDDNSNNDIEVHEDDSSMSEVNEEEEDENAESEEDENAESEESQETGGSNFKHISDANVKNQISKGTSVCNQLNIWENLVELRIQMQKSLVASNKMPQKKHYDEIKLQSGPDFLNKVSETKNVVCKALDKLLQLQKALLKQYPETKSLGKHSPKSEQTVDDNEEIPSDTDEEQNEDQLPSDDEDDQIEIPKKKRKLNDYEQEINKTHNLYKDYRNSVIQKWNEKTKIASAKGNLPVNSVVNQIDYILADRERLIKRTRLKKSSYEILGDIKEEEENVPEKNGQRIAEEYDNNIFDDDDFYHHLLRELIEFKSADLSNPTQLGQQWIQLQNLRSKMKRKIDTRATKGRKVRYTVHSKLVNFMAPIDNELMTDEAKNELFSSLFGKNQIILK